jgi:hypothetical protein
MVVGSGNNLDHSILILGELIKKMGRLKDGGDSTAEHFIQ